MQITGRQIITQALQKLNAVASNSVPTAEDIDISLSTFNFWIESKSNEFLDIHTIVKKRFLFTAGRYNYTLGPSGIWQTNRPMRVLKANLMLNPIIDGPDIDDDTATLFLPITSLPDEQFSSIRMRGITNAYPSKMYVNYNFPDTEILFWPVPSSGSKAVELWLWEPLRLQDLDNDLNLPPGYARYYIYGLACELADLFSKPLTDQIKQSYSEAESEIKSINQIPYRVKPSNAGAKLSKNSSRLYNYIDFISGAFILPRDDR